MRILVAALALVFAAAAIGQTLQSSSATKLQAGQSLFSGTCAGCHGLDGRGGEHAPNIATNGRIQKLADADLLHVIHNGISGSGMPSFGSRWNSDQIQSVVAYLRVLQGKQTALVLPGNAENGRILFFGKAQCAHCHAMEGRGGFLAADLSDYGSSHTTEETKQAITDPNNNLDPSQQAVEVTTRDGKTFSGLARNEDNFSLQLQTLDGAFHLFDKAELKQLTHLPRSLMPSNYGQTLSRSELNDLLRYLAQAGASQ